MTAPDEVIAERPLHDLGQGLAALLHAELTQRPVHIFGDVDQDRLFARMTVAPFPGG
jgi:hypothetical protein